MLQELRTYTLVGPTDYTVNSVSYFSDDQLQTLLDRTQLVSRLVPLRPIPVRNGSLTQWFDYLIPEELGIWYEETTTSGAFVVKDFTGTALTVGVDYTVNYQSRIITFATSTGGQSYLLDAKTYDLYAAAAACWRQKAGFESQRVDWSSDNHNIKASQRRDYCIKMAEYYEQKSGISGDGGITVGRFQRTDEDTRKEHYGPSDVPITNFDDPWLWNQ